MEHFIGIILEVYYSLCYVVLHGKASYRQRNAFFMSDKKSPEDDLYCGHKED